jgi:arsenite/tail-anchored protein-transporting ATPase
MPGVVDVALFDRMADLMMQPPAGVDLVVFDTAPTGHTLRMLQMPESLGLWMDALSARRRDMVERQGELRGDNPAAAAGADPVLASLERRQTRLRAVRDLLKDPSQSAVVLVMMAERLPIEETARALAALDGDRISVGGIVLNRVLPDGLSGDFYRARAAQERLYREEITRRLGNRVRAVIPQFDFDINRLADLERVSEYLVED